MWKFISTLPLELKDKCKKEKFPVAYLKTCYASDSVKILVIVK